MWAANSATVAASDDSEDGKVHISVANLSANFHRSLEADFSYKIFKKVFYNEKLFTVHEPLVRAFEFFDEGAANHIRFCTKQLDKAVHFFVYGRSKSSEKLPNIYPARQTLEASTSIARRHKLDPAMVVFAQQNPKVIDKGVFHNDVIATGHENLFFLHEEAYLNSAEVVKTLQKKLKLDVALITNKELSVHDAVNSYLFNSQIVTVNQRRIMLCPEEVEKHPRAKKVAETFPGLDDVQYIAINQSMKNGGGPACLRLCMVLSGKERRAIYPGVIFSHELYTKVRDCIMRYYPDNFSVKELQDPGFRRGILRAYAKIYELLQLEELLWNGT
jgi:succinylarginine dihydrolase